MTILVVIKTQFEGVHCWPGCNIEEVGYLRFPHRHVFHITMKWEVTDADREKEFIQMKHSVDRYIKGTYFINNEVEGMTKSCEHIALDLLQAFNACFVSVFEDGENGAEVTTL